MLAGLTSCSNVKGTPSASNLFSVSNPTGTTPKLVHIKCDPTSDAVTSNGKVIECWYTPEFGLMFTTNGSSGANVTYYESPVQQTPTSNDTYYFSQSVIEMRKGTGSATGLWSTTTEYTVEIYT